MNFGEAIVTCFKKYFVFRGRGQRSEYWFFYLFTVLASIPLSIIDAIVFSSDEVFAFSPLSDIFSYAVFIPSIAAGSRRLHDIGKSGWWQVLPLAGLALMIPALIPGLAGSFESPLFWGSIGVGLVVTIGLVILLIVWLATDSHRGPNRFGESPKYGSVADTFS